MVKPSSGFIPFHGQAAFQGADPEDGTSNFRIARTDTSPART
jgi:hypothetical protein